MKTYLLETTVLGGVGVVGAFIASMFGGWDAAVSTLAVLMLLDYFTGLAVALIWHKSPKTTDGAASSIESLRGILRKGGMLVVVIVAVRLDALMGGGSMVRDACVIALCANELLSLTENLGHMGVPIPEPLINAISVLKNRKDNSGGGDK